MPTREPAGCVTEKNYLEVSHGIKSWMLTLDHKRIGLMYLFGILGALVLGGAFALLLRTELWDTVGKDDRRRAGHVQPVLHAARRGDGVPRHHPGHPGRARQHHDADPARRALTSRSRA